MAFIWDQFTLYLLTMDWMDWTQTFTPRSPGEEAFDELRHMIQGTRQEDGLGPLKITLMITSLLTGTLLIILIGKFNVCQSKAGQKLIFVPLTPHRTLDGWSSEFHNYYLCSLDLELTIFDIYWLLGERWLSPKTAIIFNLHPKKPLHFRKF